MHISTQIFRRAIPGLVAALVSGPMSAFAGSPKALDPARFFANPAVQSERPEAFAVQAAGVPALIALEKVAPAQREALVAAIRGDALLTDGIRDFPTLPWAKRLAVLERLMAVECATFGVTTPPLVVHDEDGAGREAFFEFDPDVPGTGTVHLWPVGLEGDPAPLAAVMLTLHETRHSWQFQVATGVATAPVDPLIVDAFRAGFRAQKEIKKRLSFCDFCSLHHEHEAFQTGNQVIGALTGWTADTAGMGCWSSQFDGAGAPRIDLVSLAREVGPERLLEAFNVLEHGQFIEMGGKGEGLSR